MRDAEQLGLFEPPPDPVTAELLRLDLTHLTPIEALNLLAKWQQRLGGGLGESEARGRSRQEPSARE